jgi:exoribonuclease R
MIDESLRNKLSLKSGERKLALTLRFTVSKQGRIDFSTVRFIKSIISVDQNLTHEKLEKGIDKYQELFQVSECLGKGELMIESLLI